MLVVLLEPDYWRRRGLSAVLESIDALEVVRGEHGRADVVLISLRVVEERGPACIAALRARHRAPVLVYGDDRRLTTAADLFAAGACGYFDLSGDPAMLRRAVATVAGGRPRRRAPRWSPRSSMCCACSPTVCPTKKSATASGSPRPRSRRA